MTRYYCTTEDIQLEILSLSDSVQFGTAQQKNAINMASDRIYNKMKELYLNVDSWDETNAPEQIKRLTTLRTCEILLNRIYMNSSVEQNQPTNYFKTEAENLEADIILGNITLTNPDDTYLGDSLYQNNDPDNEYWIQDAK